MSQTERQLNLDPEVTRDLLSQDTVEYAKLQYEKNIQNILQPFPVKIKLKVNVCLFNL